MKKVVVAEIEKERWESPKGIYAGEYQGISLALGRKENSTDLRERHPFDVELTTLPPGKKAYPYHAHGAQTEFYLIVAGKGMVRDETGEHAVAAGDAFLFHPGEAHQIRNPGPEPLLFYVIADNPICDPCFYPDSNKWSVRVGKQRKLGRISEMSYEADEK